VNWSQQLFFTALSVSLYIIMLLSHLIFINKRGRIRGRGQKEIRMEKGKIIIRNRQEGQRAEKIEALLWLRFITAT
jgi:hypothetical protein